MIVFFKSYVTVAKTTEVKYRDVLCNGSTVMECNMCNMCNIADLDSKKIS